MYYRFVMRKICTPLHAVVLSFHFSTVRHWTVSVSVVECCSDPEVPVTLIVYCPAGVPGLLWRSLLPPPQPDWKNNATSSSEHRKNVTEGVLFCLPRSDADQSEPDNR